MTVPALSTHDNHLGTPAALILGLPRASVPLGPEWGLGIAIWGIPNGGDVARDKNPWIQEEAFGKQEYTQ